MSLNFFLFTAALAAGRWPFDFVFPAAAMAKTGVLSTMRATKEEVIRRAVMGSPLLPDDVTHTTFTRRKRPVLCLLEEHRIGGRVGVVTAGAVDVLGVDTQMRGFKAAVVGVVTFAADLENGPNSQLGLL